MTDEAPENVSVYSYTKFSSIWLGGFMKTVYTYPVWSDHIAHCPETDCLWRAKSV